MVTVACACVESINKKIGYSRFTNMSKFRAYMRRKCRDGMGIDYISYRYNVETGNIHVSIRLLPTEYLQITQPGYQSVYWYHNRYI